MPRIKAETFSGRPCKVGHVIRYRSTRACVVCQEERRKRRYFKDVEESRRYSRERDAIRRSKNPEKYIEKSRLKRERMREWIKANDLRWRASPKTRLTVALRHARRRAVRKGQEFSSVELLMIYLMGTDYMHCQCCHKVLDYSTGRGWKKRNDSPSIDRIDNTVGYLAGNVAVICNRCNVLKRDMTIEEMQEFAQNLLVYIRPFISSVAAD